MPSIQTRYRGKQFSLKYSKKESQMNLIKKIMEITIFLKGEALKVASAIEKDDSIIVLFKSSNNIQFRNEETYKGEYSIPDIKLIVGGDFGWAKNIIDIKGNENFVFINSISEKLNTLTWKNLLSIRRKGLNLQDLRAPKDEIQKNPTSDCETLKDSERTYKLHWIYILQCDDMKYVGETSSIVRRIQSHYGKNGSISTGEKSRKNLACVYRLNDIINFFEYDRRIEDFLEKDIFDENALVKYESIDKPNLTGYDKLSIENFMTERLLYHYKILKFDDVFSIDDKVKGGRYINPEHKFKPIFSEIFLKNYTLCKCELPCDVKLTKNKDGIFFRCPKNNFWEELISELNVKNTTPCNFYKKYEKDKFIPISRDFV